MNFNDLLPDDFSTQISDEKKRKALFVQQCREEIKIGSKYLSWIDKDFELFIDSKKVTSSKVERRVGETLKLTRERSSGPNIHDASKITITKQQDGTLLKTVTKQTYANITVRNKRKHDGDKEISEEGYRKRAKMISNILDHASNNDKKVKTKLLAKVIDQDPASGRGVKDESKVMQETNQLNPEQTTNLIAWTRMSDYEMEPSPLQVYQLFGP